MNRVDLELVARGLAPSRSAAQRLIADGAVFVGVGDERPVGKPSLPVCEADRLWVRPSVETRYVSRAGAKLEYALTQTGLQVAGRIALDAGMSTGGFAHCLIDAGALRVVGIEVGHGQLHPSLAADPRVYCFERTNLRNVSPDMLGDALPLGGFDLVVADLSFISLTLVLPALDSLMAAKADGLLLVKPQFELGPERLDRRGLVASAHDRDRAVESVTAACTALGWTVRQAFDSGLPGGDGNRESFLHVTKP